MITAHGAKVARVKLSDRCFDIVVWFLCACVFFLMAYPFYYILLYSVSNSYEFRLGGSFFWPIGFTLGNYRRLLMDYSWMRGFKLSILRTVIGTTLTVILTSIVSYALSREELKFRSFYRFLIIFSIYVSGGLIPNYILFRFLGLMNTFSVYILPSMLDAFFVIIGISFFEGIPHALYESAWIDGASEFTIFFKIVMPISLPFTATLTLFSAVAQWTAWTDTCYYVTNKALHTAAYLMKAEINRNSMNESAAMIVSMLPIMMIYPFLQRYFVKGLTLGAVRE